MSIDTSCKNAVSMLLAKDLTRWAGLPAACTLDALSGFELGNEETHSVLGEDAHPASYRRARVSMYAETFRIWLRDGKIVRISVRLPELPDPGGLLRALGAPAERLDAWSPIAPVRAPESEWVFPLRGLALVLSSDQRNVLELVVYSPTTSEKYRKLLRFAEPPREAPE